MLPSHLSGIYEPNAGDQPRLEAEARYERKLYGVGWIPLLGEACPILSSLLHVS
jgi:hypothetical protein